MENNAIKQLKLIQNANNSNFSLQGKMIAMLQLTPKSNPTYTVYSFTTRQLFPFFNSKYCIDFRDGS